jgi:transposase-like protein
MAWKPRETRKAKKYVREEVARIESLQLAPLEERVEKAEEEFKVLMENSEYELALIEKEKHYIQKFPIAKQRLVNLYVSGNYTQAQIAKILKIAPATVHRWLQDEDVLNAIEKYQREQDIVIGNSLKALRMKALNTMNELMDSQNDLVALNAAKDILDRTGHQAVQKQQVEVNMTYEERLKELINGVEIIDVDSTLVQEETNKTEGAVNGD